MEKEQTKKVQVILLCIAVILIELSIYLWIPTWQTIFITLSINLIGFSFVLELLEKGEGK